MARAAWVMTAACLILASWCVEGHLLFGHRWIPALSAVGAAVLFAWVAHNEGDRR